jgi:alpha-L-fucosidase
MDWEAYNKRIAWYRHDRFGLFIHWGLYAIPARGEWVRSVEEMPPEAYQKYFDQFAPSDYNPRQWARLCRKAGMKYAVMTAKHHDGFCLFDSALTDYKSTNTRAGRDLIKEYTEAFRAEGIRVGLYYSVIDWHHPDFPHYGDRHHPMRNAAAEQEKEPGRNFDRYLDYMHGQVKELCVNYGTIDLFWFDFSYDKLTGEAWRATELVKMIRSYWPDVLIDNRLEAGGSEFGSLLTGTPTAYSGDFVSPEQIIPPEGIVDSRGMPVCWEACMTLNNNWGYTAFDHDWKQPSTVIRKLAECVSKGGNLLLNIGPDARGRIPDASVQILTEVGEWMERNGESIYGCGQSSLDKPAWGYITENRDSIYLHVLEQTIGPVPLKAAEGQEWGLIQLLASGAELQVKPGWTTSSYPEYLFLPLGPVPHYTYPLPDTRDTVIRLQKKRTLSGVTDR